jgi:hypothetical protein|tara:strand:- start:529 stop:1626 length:1098 start_codon:yes stop_codon:yes gene_type:complete
MTNKRDRSDDDLPEELTCPITRTMFRDPVMVVESGHTYERDKVLSHFRLNGAKDPNTNLALSSTKVMTNWAVRQIVQAWLDEHPGVTPDGWPNRELLAPTAGATLVRVSDAPSSPFLPECISLQASGDTRVITFGRHRLNDVQLDCPRTPNLLSRKHAEIVCDADGLHYVVDNDTLNGTYLNGNLIPEGPCPLRNGDIIAFGGPANVLRDNRTLSNSLRFEYRRGDSGRNMNIALDNARNIGAAAYMAGFRARQMIQQHDMSFREMLRNLQETNARAEGNTWTAMSTNVDHSTPCHHCRANIPPRFLRMRRALVTGVHEYYHANYDCLRSVHNEIRDTTSIQGLDRLSEQERRILTAIASVVTSI